MSRAMDNLIREATEHLEIWMGVLETQGTLDVCESPIERAFLAAFEMHCLLHKATPHIGMPSDEIIARSRETKCLEMFIVPQWKVGSYRADFLLGMAGAGTHRQTSIIVECDGHQWHEKTREQARRDKERERALNLEVAKVIRFTGSEIHNRPLACFEEALSALDSCLFAWIE